MEKKTLRIIEQSKVYHMELDASEYDFLEVVEGENRRITIKFLDTRWRTIPETVSMLEEIIAALKTL